MMETMQLTGEHGASGLEVVTISSLQVFTLPQNRQERKQWSLRVIGLNGQARSSTRCLVPKILPAFNGRIPGHCCHAYRHLSPLHAASRQTSSDKIRAPSLLDSKNSWAMSVEVSREFRDSRTCPFRHLSSAPIDPSIQSCTSCPRTLLLVLLRK